MNKSLPPKITVQCLVANEQRWIWYALNSILDYVDEILVWDDNSSDLTPQIIKSIASPKIKYKRVNSETALGHTHLRQEMFKETTSNWFLILDGDEVWWRESIVKVIRAIADNPQKTAIVSPFLNAVGDVYHVQNSDSNKYQILGRQGAFNIRAINKSTPGLFLSNNPHGRQEYRVGDVPLQNLTAKELLYVDCPYLHLTHLRRSASSVLDKQTLKRDFKFRYELGTSLDNFPEVFYLPRPQIVPDPWEKRSFSFTIKALVRTPLRMIKSWLTFKQKNGY